jgi:hypothetical protein
MAHPRFGDRGTTSRFGGWLWTSSHGQMTRGGPPAWGLGVGVITCRPKYKHVMKYINQIPNWTVRCIMSKSQKRHNISDFNEERAIHSFFSVLQFFK